MQNNQKVLMLGGGTSSSLLLRLMASSTLVPVDLLSAFAVNDVEAALALSFTTNEYRTGNTATTFADAFTGNSPRLTYNPGSASSSQSTMVNSSGEIVWAPHNLHRYSSDFSSWASKASITAVSSSGNELGDIPTTLLSAVAGSAQHRIFDLSLTEGNPVTFSFYVKPGTFDYVQFHDGVILTYWADFDLSGNGSVIRHTGLDATPTITPVTSAGQTFFKITVQYTSAANPTTILPIISFPDPSTVVASGTRNPTWNAAGTETLYIGGAHVYRSDLGGMAPVPGAVGDFQYYVPTNGNAEYLPRVGHHVYNGSAWVNEGLLIESEARTNLITESTPVFSDFTTRGGTYADVTCDFTPLSGPGMHYSASGVDTYLYFGPTYTVADYTFSVFVEMDDGNAPSFTSSSPAHVGNDFVLVMDQYVTNPLDYTVEHYGGNTYRVSGTVTSSSTTARNTGIVKYSVNSNRTFKVTGYQLEAGSTPSSYIPTNSSTVTRGGQSLTVPAAWYDADNPTYTGPELVDTANDAAAWTAYGTNTVADAGDAVEVTYVDNFNGAYVRLREDGGLSTNLVVGETYQVNFEVKVNSGSYGVRIYNGSSYEVADSPLTNTTYVAKSYTITPTSATGAFLDFSNLSSGEVVSIRNISVRQVSAPQFGWPEPEYIGPELVVDGSGNWVGDFDVAADLDEWNALLDTTLSVASGAMRLTNGASGYATASLEITCDIGSLYQITYDVLSPSTTSPTRVIVDVDELQTSPFIASTALALTGTQTFSFVATAATHYLQFQIFSATVSAAMDFDNISVREINPLSVSIQMDGRITYADTNTYTEGVFWRWHQDAQNYGLSKLDTFLGSGAAATYQEVNNVLDDLLSDINTYTPGVLVPFNLASRHGSTFVNGAVDGTALTANTTPVALPDLSGTNLQIAYDFMGTIGTFRQFAGDIGDTGLVTATNPSTEPTLSLTFDGTGGSFYNLSWSE